MGFEPFLAPMGKDHAGLTPLWSQKCLDSADTISSVGLFNPVGILFETQRITCLVE